jgi:Tfp pilus assembly protein FimT
MEKEQGITLVELIVAISIVLILAIALGFQFQGWMSGYRVESQTKQIYSDLMYARARAMERNRDHFVTGTSNSYSIYEDTNPAPDGDGTLQTGSDTLLPRYPKTVTYALNGIIVGNTITFDPRGMISPQGSIYLTSTANADYDCLTITTTRIKMGKWDGSTSSCTEK